MTPTQVKAARAMVSLSIADLAQETGLSENTITNLEMGRSVRYSTANKIRLVLEKHGVTFTESSAGTGVHLSSR